MHPFPHAYRVTATATPAGDVGTASPGLESLAVAPPPEFDGPGGRWSPETLLCAAIANCLLLTFRSAARVARLDWTTLAIEVEGRLERQENVTRFTHFTARARLELPPATDAARALQLLQRAERGCLVSNSLRAPVELLPEVVGGSGT